jgi:hypothetical protein
MGMGVGAAVYATPAAEVAWTAAARQGKAASEIDERLPAIRSGARLCQKLVCDVPTSLPDPALAFVHHDEPLHLLGKTFFQLLIELHRHAGFRNIQSHLMILAEGLCTCVLRNGCIGVQNVLAVAGAARTGDPTFAPLDDAQVLAGRRLNNLLEALAANEV